MIVFLTRNEKELHLKMFVANERFEENMTFKTLIIGTEIKGTEFTLL